MENSEEPKTPEQYDPSRRSFLKLSTGIISGLAGLVLAVPFLDALISQSLRVKLGKFVDAGPISDLPEGSPQKMFFDEREKDAYIEEVERRDVWAIKHKGKDDVTVFSPICPHLGCRYNWHPELHEFICPCHGSHFAEDGKLLKGPALRGLDTLPKEFKDGDLYVKWERFKLDCKQKIVIGG